MSTSEADSLDRLAQAAAGKLEELQVKPPIPVADLQNLANSFFRALPGQSGLPAAPSVVPPPAAAVPAPGWNASGISGPSLAAVVPPAQNFSASSAAFPSVAGGGFPAPGVPSLPAADKVPNEAELVRTAGEAAQPGGGRIVPSLSALPLTPGVGALAVPQSAVPGSVEAAVVPAAEINPFSIALPEELFAASAAFLASQGTGYDAALPVLSDLAAYPTGDATEILQLASQGSYYFLGGAANTATPSSLDPLTRVAADPLQAASTGVPAGFFDVSSIRRDFPILNERVNGKQIVWLDNAATTQKPQAVIDRLAWFYAHENSNIHRAAHELAARATDAYEEARQKVAQFVHASSPTEIVFVRGATEGINLVAQSWGRQHIQRGDEIIVSTVEHHANIVPWQQLAAEKGAVLRVIPVDDDGQVILSEYEKLLNRNTRLVSVAQVSNALGTVLPVGEIVAAAHRYGARVLVDGAQSVSHQRTDVQALDCDFFVFSGHKVYGPTGIGAVYGKPDVWQETPPWQGGGNMIADVTFEKTLYQGPPARFEAGTGNIADAVGLGAAIDYVQAIGMENIARYEHELLEYGLRGLKSIPGLRLIGTAKEKAAVLSFVLDGYKTEEVGAALNQEGIAVRSGHHCAQPSLRRFGVESAVRPSLGIYNTYDDLDALLRVLRKLKGVSSST